MREIHERIIDDLRAVHARAPKSAEWRQLEAELEAQGIDATELRIFSPVVPTSFERRRPTLVHWPPRVHDTVEKEVIARSVTG